MWRPHVAPFTVAKKSMPFSSRFATVERNALRGDLHRRHGGPFGAILRRRDAIRRRVAAFADGAAQGGTVPTGREIGRKGVGRQASVFVFPKVIWQDMAGQYVSITW